MNQEPTKAECKGCNKTFAINSIVQHVVRSKCKSKVSEEEITNLRTASKNYGDAKKKLKMDERYQRKKASYASTN